MRTGLAQVAFLVCSVASPLAAPQNAREGQIFVRVVDQAGFPVAGVEVTVSRCLLDPSRFPTPGPSTCVRIERVTDAYGEASFPSVSIGNGVNSSQLEAVTYNYWIATSKDGYTVAHDVVTLRPARNEFDLTIYRVRDNPILVLFENAKDTAGEGNVEAAEEMMADAAVQMAQQVDALFGSAFPEELYVRALTLLADYRIRLGRYDGAEEALLQADALEPSDPFTLRTLTIVAAARQEWAQAELRAQNYLAARPEDPDALMLLGVVYLETRRFPEAIDYLQQSSDISPEWPPLHRMLGVAYEASGRPRDAIQHYERYLELAGEPDDQAEIEAAISRLRVR